MGKTEYLIVGVPQVGPGTEGRKICSTFKYLGSVFNKKGVTKIRKKREAAARIMNSVLYDRNISIITKSKAATEQCEV
jgi:hypothetical protein